jgi:flagellar biogenesis protein FliO
MAMLVSLLLILLITALGWWLAERTASPKASKSSKFRQTIATVASAPATGHDECLGQRS